MITKIIFYMQIIMTPSKEVKCFTEFSFSTSLEMSREFSCFIYFTLIITGHTKGPAQIWHFPCTSFLSFRVGLSQVAPALWTLFSCLTANDLGQTPACWALMSSAGDPLIFLLSLVERTLPSLNCTSLKHGADPSVITNCDLSCSLNAGQSLTSGTLTGFAPQNSLSYKWGIHPKFTPFCLPFIYLLKCFFICLLF